MLKALESSTPPYMLGEIDIAVIEKLHVIFGSCPRHWVPKDTSPQPVDWRLGAGHARSTPQPHEVSLTFPQLARDADREELHSLIVEMREIFMVAGTFPRGDKHSLHLQLSQLDAALEFRVRSAASLRHSTRLFAAAEQLTAEDEEQDPDYTVDDESDSEAEEEVRICAPCTQFGGLELKEYTDLEHFLDEQLGEEICWPKWPPTLDSTQPPQLQGIHSCLDELEYSVEPCADPLCCHSPNACTVVSLSNLEPFIDHRTFPQPSHGECRFRQALQRRPASVVTLSATHRRDVRCRRAVARQAAERSVRSCERWLIRMWDAAQTVGNAEARATRGLGREIDLLELAWHIPPAAGEQHVDWQSSVFDCDTRGPCDAVFQHAKWDVSGRGGGGRRRLRRQRRVIAIEAKMAPCPREIIRVYDRDQGQLRFTVDATYAHRDEMVCSVGRVILDVDRVCVDSVPTACASANLWVKKAVE